MGNRNINSVGALARRCRAFFSRLNGDRRGNVLTEMALVMPMFATLAVATFDMGRFAIEQNRLEQIARAGVNYVLQNIALAGDDVGIEAAATAAALVAAGPDTAGIVVNASRVCGCPGVGITADCGGFCDDGNVKAVILDVTVTHTLVPIFAFPSFIETQNLTATVKVVVQ